MKACIAKTHADKHEMAGHSKRAGTAARDVAWRATPCDNPAGLCQEKTRNRAKPSKASPTKRR